MAVSRPLRRLLRILDMEEEQRRLALESALGELRQLEKALVGAGGRDRGGRRLVAASAASGEVADRQAGIEETRAGQRLAAALKPRIAEAESDAVELHEKFLAKRVERRQAETLVEEAEARDAIEGARRGQRSLDDWYLNRFRGAGRGAEAAGQSGAGRPTAVGESSRNLRKN